MKLVMHCDVESKSSLAFPEFVSFGVRPSHKHMSDVHFLQHPVAANRCALLSAPSSACHAEPMLEIPHTTIETQCH
jgi:hypothetical protein